MGFYRWAYKQGLVAESPADDVPTVRAPRLLPRPLTAEQVARAIDLAPTPLRAWVLLMAGAGLRCIEVAALEPRDVFLEPTPTLMLRVTKGGEQQTVPLHPLILAELRALPVRNGLWWNVDRQKVSYMVGTYLRSVGIQASAHNLRHTAITEWYQASQHDLITTQRLARHAALSSTQIYADVAPVRPAEVVAAMRIGGRAA